MLPQTVYSTSCLPLHLLLLPLPVLAAVGVSLRAACATWRCNTVHGCVLFMCIVWHPVSILYWAILCFMAPQCTQLPHSSKCSAACWECSASASDGSSSKTDSRLLTSQSKLTNYPAERQLATLKDTQLKRERETTLYSKYIFINELHQLLLAPISQRG